MKERFSKVDSILNLFFFTFYLFIFIFGCVGSSLLCTGFLQLRRSGATLHCGVRASNCSSFSCCRAWALGARASVVVAHRLQSAGSVVVAHGMWDLPGPGLEPMSPALGGGFLTTAPPGKSLHIEALTICIAIRNLFLINYAWLLPRVILFQTIQCPVVYVQLMYAFVTYCHCEMTGSWSLPSAIIPGVIQELCKSLAHVRTFLHNLVVFVIEFYVLRKAVSMIMISSNAWLEKYKLAF